jgi:hypothetical protein
MVEIEPPSGIVGFVNREHGCQPKFYTSCNGASASRSFTGGDQTHYAETGRVFGRSRKCNAFILRSGRWRAYTVYIDSAVDRLLSVGFVRLKR